MKILLAVFITTTVIITLYSAYLLFESHRMIKVYFNMIKNNEELIVSNSEMISTLAEMLDLMKEDKTGEVLIEVLERLSKK